MSRFYGQGTSLQAGDYLYDQLWWTRGVKVSSRILRPRHTRIDWGPNGFLFIPKFNRSTGWYDSKGSHVVSDPRTGGAIRLLDTMRPSFSTDPKYNQPLCSNLQDDAESYLGAPNQKCPGGGPGKYD